GGRLISGHVAASQLSARPLRTYAWGNVGGRILNFTCDHCERTYSIPDERVRGRTVQVRCRNCQNILVLTGPPADERPPEELTRAVSIAELAKLKKQSRAAAENDWDPEETRAAPAPDPIGLWFVLIRGAQQGPLTVPELTEAIRKRDVQGKSYVWRQGLKQ